VPSAQNAAGTAFNPDTFLTNWGKISPEAKDALFGAQGSTKSLRRSLDSLEDTASTTRKSTIFRNPSGTAEAAGHAWGLWGMLGESVGAALGHGVMPIAGTAGAVTLIENKTVKIMVPGIGLEPTTRALRMRCSTN
jgi:hypothetical protein